MLSPKKYEIKSIYINVEIIPLECKAFVCIDEVKGRFGNLSYDVSVDYDEEQHILIPDDEYFDIVIELHNRNIMLNQCVLSSYHCDGFSFRTEHMAIN